MSRVVLRDYLLVAKPRLVAANLVSGAGGFLLAARGQVHPGLFLSVLAGLAGVVASGCVFNNVIDRGIDREMSRTRGRALARGSISPAGSLAYAAGLGAVGALILFGLDPPAALAVALAGFAVYVGAYSLYLKRRSVWSTVVGSLAGAAPPLAAYLAARGGFDLGAGVVLAIFCLWQIPHSYAITIVRYDDYAAAGIPVMPVRAGVTATRRHILLHIAAFALVAPLLTAFGYAGRAYLASAVVVGAGWLGLALAGYWSGDEYRWARRVYLFSLAAVVILSVMMAVDNAWPPV